MRDPLNFLERRHAFAQIVKRGGGVLGHTWAVGTRAELDAAGWAEEAYPNEDVADY